LSLALQWPVAMVDAEDADVPWLDADVAELPLL
jgi:hypothetical protein